MKNITHQGLARAFFVVEVGEHFLSLCEHGSLVFHLEEELHDFVLEPIEARAEVVDERLTRVDTNHFRLRVAKRVVLRRPSLTSFLAVSRATTQRVRLIQDSTVKILSTEQIKR